MKTKFILSFILLTIVSCGSPTEEKSLARPTLISEAQERGNGSDYISADGHSAWFSGSGKTFSYCMKTAPDFGVSAQDVKLTIDEAIKMWRDYAKDRAPDSQIVFTGKFVSLCSPGTDLVFDLGSARESRAKDIQHVGLTTRHSFDKKTKWSRGTIWIAAQGSIQLDEFDSRMTKTMFPDWSERKALRAILLHELGHVFGVDHADLTIMDERLAHYLASNYDGSTNKDFRDKLLSGIDGHQELLPSETHIGSLGLPSDERFKESCAGLDVENFELLTGTKPQGSIRAEFRKTGYKEYVLGVSDSRQSFEFRLQNMNPDLPSYNHVATQYVFSEWREDRDGLSWNYGKTRPSATSSLKIETKSGENIYLSYHENLMSVFSLVRNDMAANEKIREYAAAGQVLVMHTNRGPRYLFISSLFLISTADGYPNPRDREPSCRVFAEK